MSLTKPVCVCPLERLSRTDPSCAALQTQEHYAWHQAQNFQCNGNGHDYSQEFCGPQDVAWSGNTAPYHIPGPAPPREPYPGDCTCHRSLRIMLSDSLFLKTRANLKVISTSLLYMMLMPMRHPLKSLPGADPLHLAHLMCAAVGTIRRTFAERLYGRYAGSPTQQMGYQQKTPPRGGAEYRYPILRAQYNQVGPLGYPNTTLILSLRTVSPVLLCTSTFPVKRRAAATSVSGALPSTPVGGPVLKCGLS